MRSLKLGFFFLAALGFQSVSAQLQVFPKPYKNNAFWTVNGKLVDTLFLGASFTRTSFKPVTVSLKGNEAGWTGDLLFIDPKTGVEDRLFSNHDAPGTTVTLSDRHDIGIGDTVYFIYKVVTPVNGNFPSANSRLPKYTGPNIPNVSKYWSLAGNGKYGNRWSVAGRMNDSLVIFGFEDNVDAGSDFDYDDIVFLTTLSLANDEVPPNLTFVDRAGLPLQPGAFFSPANDTVWLVYTDDYNSGKDPVTFNINVKNRRGAAAADVESITGVVPTRNGITGTWKLAIPLKEAPGVPGDKLLQVFWLGEITATVASHTRNQIPDGNTVSATLNVAYPDKPETVDVRSCPDSAADITRTTTCISVRVVDQGFTRNLDTVYAEVKCDLSGDIIAKVALIEQADGSYRSVDIVKNEDPANPGNQILSCKSTDNITVTYTDEVYNKKVTDKAAWSGDAPEGLIFSQVGNNNTPLTSVKDGEGGNTFQVVAKGPSPTVGVKDTIQVTVTSAQGDVETFTAVETDVNSNVYTVQMGFQFQTTPPASGNGKIEAFLDPAKVVLNVPVVGTAVINGKAYTANITLLPSLNLAKNAYIKDTDGDGRADKVFIVFTRPLEELPATVTPLYWNEFAPANAAKGTPVITMGDQPNIVVVDFTANQFPAGLTEVPLGAAKPIATLPSTNVFGGQKVEIADSVGPVIMRANIKPFNNLTVTPGVVELDVDTLLVVVSEALRTRTDWVELVRVGAAKDGKCNDYAGSRMVTPYGQPVQVNDTTYQILINKAPRVLTSECVYMNVNGNYTDLVSNLPPVHGVKVTGEAPPVAVRMQGYPPVAGLNANNPGFVMVNNDPRTGGIDGNGDFSRPVGNVYQTFWVPPADWPAGWTAANSNVLTNVYNPEGHLVTDPIQEGRDLSIPVQMPSDIGAVRVVVTTPYVANVAIFDNLGHFVQKFSQSFGYRGEMSNQNRKDDKGMASFLVWNLKDSKGRRVGNGVYIWKAVFNFKNGKQEIRYVRTGVTRAKGN